LLIRPATSQEYVSAILVVDGGFPVHGIVVKRAVIAIFATWCLKVAGDETKQEHNFPG
jgi:hypothetical protein